MNVSKLNERSAWSRSSRTRRLFFVVVAVVGVTLGVVLAMVDQANLGAIVLSASGMILAWMAMSTPPSTF